MDTDGNVLLDLCSGETLPVGHNHDVFISSITSNSHLDFSIINANLDAAERASSDMINMIGDVLEPHAPSGLPAVTLTSQANAAE